MYDINKKKKVSVYRRLGVERLKKKRERISHILLYKQLMGLRSKGPQESRTALFEKHLGKRMMLGMKSTWNGAGYSAKPQRFDQRRSPNQKTWYHSTSRPSNRMTKRCRISNFYLKFNFGRRSRHVCWCLGPLPPKKPTYLGKLITITFQCCLLPVLEVARG